MNVIAAGAKSAIVDPAVAALKLKNSLKYSDPDDVNYYTMLDIGRTHLKEGTRAFKFFEHFLKGSGSAIIVDPFELLNEDEGARNRLVCESVRRGLASYTLRESKEYLDRQGKSVRDADKFTSIHRRPQSFILGDKIMDPVITIKQETYKSQDWQYTLGTFPFEMIRVFPYKDGDANIVVELQGENIYQWHEWSARISQSVHELGAALVKAKRAANFNMIVKPFVLAINIRHAKIVQMSTAVNEEAYKNAKQISDLFSGKQTDPSHSKSTFTIERFKRGWKVLTE